MKMIWLLFVIGTCALVEANDDACSSAQFVSKPWKDLRKYVFRNPYPVNRFPKTSIQCEMNNKTIDVKLLLKHPYYGLTEVKVTGKDEKEMKVVKEGQTFTIEMMSYGVPYEYMIGKYICSACTSKKTLEVGSILWITEPRTVKPQIIGPNPNPVGIASEVTMKCESGYGMIGTESRLKWYKMVKGSRTSIDGLDGIGVESIASTTTSSGIFDEVKLTINKFTSNYVGKYLCVRTNVAGIETSDEVDVVMQDYREVTTSINFVIIPTAKYDTMKIDCHVNGSDALQFGWTKTNGKPMKRRGVKCKLRQYVNVRKSSLFMTNFYGRKYSGKTFICQGSNVDGDGKKRVSHKTFYIIKKGKACPSNYECKEAVDNTCFCKT